MSKEKREENWRIEFTIRYLPPSPHLREFRPQQVSKAS